MRLIAYQWMCEGCGQKVEVMRTMDDNQVPPKGDELPPPCAGGCKFHRDYQRPKNCKGFILKEGGAGGFHDHEYTKYRSIK